MTIEKLDQSKRDALESGTATPYVQDEALRIIDQLTAALEAAETQRDEARGEYARLQTNIDLLPPSALAAELKAEKQRFAAMVLEFGGLKDAAEARARLTAELEAGADKINMLERSRSKENLRAVSAESRSEALQARVAELEAEKEHAVKCAAEAELRFEDAVKVAMGRVSAETVAQLREESATRLAYSEQWRSEALAARAKLAAAEAELADLRERVARAETYLRELGTEEPIRKDLEGILRGR